MSTITVLGLVLLGLMTWIGGKQGISSFLSLLFNFGVLFFAIVLIAFHFSPIIVALVTGIIVLALTIFMGGGDDLTSQTAFFASVIVLLVLIVMIIPVVNWAQIQGFGQENSEDLEGMSLLIGINLLKIAMVTAIISTLGAIAEAAMAISAGLVEIVTQRPKIEASQLYHDGLVIGRHIIGTTFNTLFFGFFGGFLALFIWFASVGYSFGEILNDKVFVSEILMILFSMIGVIITVPLTALVMKHEVTYRRKHDQPLSDL
ncbi:predicted multitransmembrane protein [Secundilactobacillus oryzae JCM 18671]|uniref:Predicted multitransmembrane protein n=1 Tax=Secundilactobacillus oryzae JCM 18671 TaxID=1291743 RepID=A0A081BJ84_9LACO|nr:YibE/F family protein [Secundilactobacillus oryzae]GAK48102.1 predicted multitransmembrane protein [Secundilactobacillus oryzae JCM 18671]